MPLLMTHKETERGEQRPSPQAPLSRYRDVVAMLLRTPLEASLRTGGVRWVVM
jgi:hypothetical protein